MNIIDRFDGRHAYLSNFAAYPVLWDGQEYSTNEHAFAAAKTFDPQLRRRIQAAGHPREAKALGRALHLRPDWEKVKYSVMVDLQISKYTSHPQLRTRLAATGDALLIEGATRWHDNIWGRVKRRQIEPLLGRNLLGRAITHARRLIDDGPADRWTRAAITGHRDLPAQKRFWVLSEIDRVTEKLVDDHHTHTALSGLDDEVSVRFAQAALASGMALWGYLRWQPEPDSRTAHHRRLHADLCLNTERLITYSDHHDTDDYQDGNQLLIGDADVVVAVFDPRRPNTDTGHALTCCVPGQPVILIDLQAEQTRRIDGARAIELGQGMTAPRPAHRRSLPA